MAIKKPSREFPFIPRIINPVKIEKVVIFSAEARIRESSQILHENMPWLKTEILYSPQSVSRCKSGQATVFLFDDTALPLVDSEKIRMNNPDSVVVLLSANSFIHSSPRNRPNKNIPTRLKLILFLLTVRQALFPRSLSRPWSGLPRI